MVRAGERVHVLGIAGSGAAGTAVLLQRAGAVVDGCDADAPSPYTPQLDRAGIGYAHGHDATHVDGAERLAITPAMRAHPENTEVKAALARGVPIVTWQALLGELMAAPERIGVGVAGTHGKSTTTALLGHLLEHAGLDPTVEVGAPVPAWQGSVRVGDGAPFVVEADEFGDNFLNYHPSVAIVTNVEMDHPDYFADAEAVLGSFTRFVGGMRPHPTVDGRLLVIAAGDGGGDALLSRLGDWEGRVVRYGPGGEVTATDVAFEPGRSRFELFGQRFETTLGGAHNVLNATAALVVARALGASAETLVDGLRSFAGAGRRMERIADTARVTVFDDYGHHPTEVRAAIAAARQHVGRRRLWAVFEPHMYSRTALLFDEFAGAFTDADEVVVVDIFASRDTDASLRATSAEELADAIERVSAVPTIATGDVTSTTDYLVDHVAEGDAVLVMGAGKSYHVAHELAARLAEGGA